MTDRVSRSFWCRWCRWCRFLSELALDWARFSTGISTLCQLLVEKVFLLALIKIFHLFLMFWEKATNSKTNLISPTAQLYNPCPELIKILLEQCTATNFANVSEFCSFVSNFAMQYFLPSSGAVVRWEGARDRWRRCLDCCGFWDVILRHRTKNETETVSGRDGGFVILRRIIVV